MTVFEDEGRSRRDITALVDEGDASDSSETYIDEKTSLKEKLIEEFERDPLYPMVAEDYDIFSDDILELDPSNVYSTKDVVQILSKYDYLYDAIKGESYINENRIRWWLNKEDNDNLLDYFKLQKPGRSWIWDLNAIVKAKIVAILRFAKNHQQKMIKYYTTGIQPNTPKISDENVVTLIEEGNLDKVKDFDVLKQITLAAIQYMSKETNRALEEYQKLQENYQQLYGEIDSLKEENEELRKKLDVLNQNSVSRQELSEYNKKRELDIEKRDREITVRFEVTRELKKEALLEWDKENSGFFKRFKIRESEKEEFIEEYIKQRLDDRIKQRIEEYNKK